MEHPKRWLKILLTFVLPLSLTSCFEKLPMTTVHVVTEWGRQINELYLLTTIIVTVIFLRLLSHFAMRFGSSARKKVTPTFPSRFMVTMY